MICHKPATGKHPKNFFLKKRFGVLGSAAGKLDKVKFRSFDLSPTILQALVAGQMDFAIDQQQFLQGYLPVVIMANYIKSGLLPATASVSTGPGFVTKENAKQVIELSKKDIR